MRSHFLTPPQRNHPWNVLHNQTHLQQRGDKKKYIYIYLGAMAAVADVIGCRRYPGRGGRGKKRA